jgi:DNA-binding transcriptional MerR regulator
VDYRIEELAEAAKTTIRNIRAYQERGLLPAPRREGRLAWYGDAHLARLRVIGALLERGYSLGNIAELLTTWESGSDLRDVLGLEAAITSPFTDEAPTTLTLADLATLFGSLDPVAIAHAVKVGMLVVDGAELRAPSMRLLKVGAELHRAGVPLKALLDEVAALAADTDHIATRFVALIEKHVFDAYEGGLPPPEDTPKLTELIRRIRPMAELAVDTMLAQALERCVRAGLGQRLARGIEGKKPATKGSRRRAS